MANDERENIALTLDKQGSPNSWLQVTPRFKIDRIGDNIQSNIEIYLSVVERKNEFIHAADRHITVQRPREVNCSLDPSSWRINIFTSSVDYVDSTILLANDMVSIFDAETRSYLTILKKDAGCRMDSEGDDDSSAMSGALSPKSNAKSSSTASPRINGLRSGELTPRVDSGFDLNADRATSDEIEFLAGVCEVVIRPSEGALDSNAIWVMESETLVRGGPIEWKAQQVRLKNLNTGLYLMVEETTRQVASSRGGSMIEDASHDGTDSPDELNTAREEAYITFTLTSNRNDLRTLLFNQEIYSSRPELRQAKPLQLYTTQITTIANLWLCRGENILVEDNNKVSNYFMTKFGFDKNEAISFLINRYHPSDSSTEVGSASTDASGPEVGGEEEDSGSFIPKMMDMPMDVHTGVCLRVFFDKYLEHTIVPHKFGKVSTFWPKLLRADMVLFESVINKCVCFAQGYHISTESVDPDAVQTSSALRQKRQNLLREQGVLEILLQIIHKLIPLSSKMDQLIRDSAPMDGLPEPMKQLFAMSANVLQCCLSVIYNSIRDNTDTQLYVANFMPILLAHLNAHPLAGTCVTEMLNNNMELQETKIGDREITIFIEKLKESKYNGMYLRLLQSCCSCQGDGVDGNQRMVVLKMLEDTKDCFMTIHCDYKVSIYMNWHASGSEESIYIPQVLLHKGEDRAEAPQADDMEEKQPLLNAFGNANGNGDQWASGSVRSGSGKSSGVMVSSRPGTGTGPPTAPKTAPPAGMLRASFSMKNLTASVTSNIHMLSKKSPSHVGLDLRTSPVKGDKLVLDGVPRLYVTWMSSNVEYSPQGVFNKISVSLEELFPVGSVHTPGTTTSRSPGSRT